MMKSLNELREEMLAVARGERKPSPIPARPPTRHLFQVLASADNRDLLAVIHHERPETVSRLAEITGRAQSNISRSLHQLAKHGLITLAREGREVRAVPGPKEFNFNVVDGSCAVKRVREIA